jgi:hypothetical protein
METSTILRDSNISGILSLVEALVLLGVPFQFDGTVVRWSEECYSYHSTETGVVYLDPNSCDCNDYESIEPYYTNLFYYKEKL